MTVLPGTVPRSLMLALALIIVVPAGTVAVLHYRSRDPHTAMRRPIDRDNVSAFIAAFGHRDDRRAGLRTSDLGETLGELDIAVPCRGDTAQHVVVPFAWKRTSYISSGWYASIAKPGTADVLPSGCAAP